MTERVDDEIITHTLNILLTSLQIPITLETPLDLTPSLILAVFESTLRTRLPISHATRQARTHKDKVEAMKIVLGVLEDDVLGVDVGLENVDPRRLAEGKPDEVRYVGEVLCWLGRKTGYLEELSRMDDEKPKMATRPDSTSSPRSMLRSRQKAKATSKGANGNVNVGEDVFGPIRPTTTLSPSIASASLDSSLLIHSSNIGDDSHTAMSLHDALNEGDESDTDTTETSLDDFSILQPQRDTSNHRQINDVNQSSRPPLEPDATIDLDEVTAFLDSRDNCTRNRQQPRSHLSDTSIEHETPRRPIRVPSRRYDDDTDSEAEPDESIEESFCRCAPKELPPVRKSGYIDTVDFEQELRSFEAQRRSVKTPTSAHLGRSMGPRPRFTGLGYGTPIRTPTRSPIDASEPKILTRHISPSQHTLALLEERARLLEELARMKIERD